MSSINSDEIISILKEEIENFDSVSKDSEVGMERLLPSIRV